MFRNIISLLRNLDANLLTLLGEVRHTNKLLQFHLDVLRDGDEDMTPEMWDAATALLMQRKRVQEQRVRGERL